LVNNALMIATIPHSATIPMVILHLRSEIAVLSDSETRCQKWF